MPEKPMAATSDGNGPARDASPFAAPQVALPKGGGAIRGIGEKFAANPVTGTGSLTIPIAVSPGRSGFSPQLALAYDSGAGNGPFGLGWSLSLPSITRRTDKGLPQYHDDEESDVLMLSGAEDLVRELVQDAQGAWQRQSDPRDGYVVARYRPRVEGLFSRIERWSRQSDGDTFWRSISKDNVTTLYGKTPESRVADPVDPNGVFTWLICESRDDRGNALAYEYVPEDSSNVDLSQANERNRTAATRAANRYLKRIKYGNVPPLAPQGDIGQLSWLFEVVFDYGEGHYGEKAPDAHGSVFATASLSGNHQTWPVRQDPFSHYRARFEVRSYRLCRRVLMFHHFPAELGVADYLVRATEFSYRETPIASFITSVTQSGFVRQGDGTYLKRSLPSLDFEYTQAQVLEQALQNAGATVALEVRDLDRESLANLPSDFDGTRYRWLDLDGEGLQGVLAEQDEGWYFKRNLSPLTFDPSADPVISAQFEPLSEVSRLPAFAELRAPRHQFLDLAGDGQLDCVVLERPVPGFFKRAEDESWDQFAPLPSAPNVDWADANLRFVDVDGDGHADLLITESEVLTWYPSLAEAGFGAPIRVPKARNEEDGPAIVFADSTQSIFLADMSGDGLTDIVRIRNGEVCYWPNLGYGRFGTKVAMDQAPRFDTPDLFDAKRIRLADTDGSGVTDIIYLAPGGVRLYFNQSGNAWSAPASIADFPRVDDLSAVQALDLLGNGTACLVWTSPLPGDFRRFMRYIDLMGGQKPHLLVKSRNNLGAETRVTYAPSTKFYLADREAGQPWATRLPFPVHVVERVETDDRVSRNRFVTRYLYHHGYYDGIEREFRGFGMVEQLDTEELGALGDTGAFPDATNIDAASYVPPVLTKTWFHTGAFPQGPRVSRVFETEYYRESDPVTDPDGLTEDEYATMMLPDTELPADLSGDEVREAIRSLKGAILRQEIYANDQTGAAGRPYSVSERNYTVNRIQLFGPNRHAAFFTHARETVDFHYERTLYDVGARKLADPRVTHSMVLAVDDYGNELQSVAIAYGRRHDDPDPLLTVPDQEIQKKIHVTCTESSYTNPILDKDAYRTPLPAEVRTYELIKVTPDRAMADVTNLFGFSEIAAKVSQAGDSKHDLPYEDLHAAGATEAHPYRRLIEQVRTLYRKEDLTGLLSLGVADSKALPGANYKLAFTPGLLSIYERGQQNLLPTPTNVLRDEGKYVLSDDQKTADLFPATDPNGQWWIPSGRVFYSPSKADTPAQELANAQAHFFLPRRFEDPFGNSTTVDHDDPHDLLVVRTADALANTVTSANDYRVLQPALLTDPNGNRSAVVFDGLGLVVASAAMGKKTEKLGDSLAQFTTDVTQMTQGQIAADPAQADIDAFFASPRGPSAAALLGGATSRFVYDLGRYVRSPGSASPAFAATVVRETHVSDLGQGQSSKLQVSLGYSDGFGREIQRKIQAEPGPVVENGPNVDPRWAGSGWTIFNNKGKPVRQYEPFFDDTHDFKFGVKIGVSPILFYDPVGRVVATVHPNQSWEKVVFDPWRQETWDVNDTVLIADPKTDPDAGPFFERLPVADFPSTWYAQRINGALGPRDQDAAQKASIHANTPATAFFDALGRAFLTVADNRFVPQGSQVPVEELYRTLAEIDIEGNQRSVTDALGRKVMMYDYDMLGTRIHQNSMDAGERWMLNDCTGKAIRSWDARGHNFRVEYDALRRPTGLFVLGTDQVDSDPRTLAAEVQYEKSTYGESQQSPELLNLRTRLFQHADAAGMVTSKGHNPVTNLDEGYDFKGNLLRSSRAVVTDYKGLPNWKVPPATPESFASSTQYDALNRPVALTTPDASVIRPSYNEANLLETLNVNLRGAAAATPFVSNIDYNAKGQRLLIEYGNGASTNYEYDKNTFRLTHLTTKRKTDKVALQALSYFYDPIGNITHIQDDADIQNVVFFRNKRVEPSNDYTYDAIYRLIQASGREQLGLNGGQPLPPAPSSYNDVPRVGLLHPGDGNAIGTYSEQYQYDAAGNFVKFMHEGTGPANPGWTRSYTYSEPSLLEAGKVSNRLTSTALGGSQTLSEPYTYDLHGNMTSMPQLQVMVSDFKDQLTMTRRQAVNAGDTDGVAHQGERTYCVYDAAGQRVRKTTESAAGIKTKERFYIGGYELYREYDAGGNVTLARESLHVMDDKRRVALVETTTIDAKAPPNSLPSTAIRYQFDNHLGSACLELDENAAVISYEEYYPYGSTSYQAGRSAAEVSTKRYRYTGKERDNETGLYYHGARHCAPWLGRWTAPDPAGLRVSSNLFAYANCNPVRMNDPTGLQGTDITNPKKNAQDPQTQADATKQTQAGATGLQKKQSETGQATGAGSKPTDKDKKDEGKSAPEATVYLFTPAQSGAEDTIRRHVFEAALTQAFGQGHLTTDQITALYRNVSESHALGFSISVQKDSQSKDFAITIGGIYHGFKKDEDEKSAVASMRITQTGIDVGLYLSPIATVARTGDKTSVSFGASAVGALSKDLDKNVTLDLNATVSGTSSNQLTDAKTTLGPSGAFGLTGTLTFKPGRGWVLPISGGVTWTSGYGQSAPGSTTPSSNTTASTRFDAAIGVGKLGALGLPFLGVSGQFSNEKIVPPYTAPTSVESIPTGTISIVARFR
jgi:RHS repeat-associated protein